MQVHRNIDALPLFKNAVITIGTFDGVHTGHQKVIQQLKEEAGAVDGESVVITFFPHPREVLAPQNGRVKLINTLDEKTELLSKQHIDHLVVAPFTLSFSQLSANEYVHDFLYKRFHPHTLITGYDHRFGHDRKGDYLLLEKYGAELGFNVREIPEHLLHSIIVSSTEIRRAITVGNIAKANELLGYDFFFEGEVIEGNKLGRTLGYPTANLNVADKSKLIPANGVYVVEATGSWIKTDERLKGMMNIGIRPTLEDKKYMIEVHLFGFNQNIYGEKVRVYVKEYLRPEIKFNNIEELKEQLALDKMDTLRYLSNH